MNVFSLAIHLSAKSEIIAGAFLPD